MTTRRAFVGAVGATLVSSSLPASGSRPGEGRGGRRVSPFLFWHEDTIVVPITVNGVKTAGILDSAAAVSMIDRRLANAANIMVTSAGQSLAGPGGRLRASKTGPFQLALGDFAALLAWTAVIDLSDVSEAMGWPVGFLVGQDVLRQCLLDFRFDEKQFSVASDSEAPDLAGLEEVKLGRGLRQEPTIDISIEGKPPVSAAVDTGNSSPLLLSPAYAEQSGLLSRRSSTALSATASGISTNRLITVASLRMDHLQARDVPTEVYSSWTSNGSPANIGMPLLAGRRLVFDFGRDRLWRSISPAAPLRRDRSGLGLAVKADRLLVMHVASGSPAESGGFRVDDQIVEIDGRRVDGSYNEGDLWRWRFRPAGDQVELTLSTGAKRKLRLANYY